MRRLANISYSVVRETAVQARRKLRVGTCDLRHYKKLSPELGEFASNLLADVPVQGIVENLLTRIVDVLPVTAAAITLIGSDARPGCLAASGDVIRCFASRQFEQGPGESAYLTGEIVQIPDLREDTRFPRYTAEAAAAGLAATFAFPLTHGTGRLGTLDLYRDTPGPLKPHDTEMAQQLADIATAYIRNAQGRDAAVRVQPSALYDALTGLPNRLLLAERLESAAKRSAEEHTGVAVLFTGLDRFKQINDTYGHKVGDELLVAVATRLRASLRPSDTLARMSGDEFVLLCEKLPAGFDIEALATDIDAVFSVPLVVAGLVLNVTASIGMAYAEPDELVSNQLVVDADTAMHQAKRKGGGTHQLVDVHEAKLSMERSTLEQDLHAAFARRELRIAYQPVVRSTDGLIIGVEALLRWTHPDRGPVPPLDMVSIAEDDGLITKLGAWILERACTDHAEWIREYPDTPLSLAVNVSARQIMSPNFSATVAAVIARTNMDPAALVLEITEGIFIQDSTRALEVMMELKALGVSLALDDFGTGYSSLSYLRQFPVDILKIDQIFVATMGGDTAGAAIVAAVANLAHALGLSVIAEGVETNEQREEIIALGCENAQGFLYSSPLYAEELCSLLTSGGNHRLRLLARTP